MPEFHLCWFPFEEMAMWYGTTVCIIKTHMKVTYVTKFNFHSPSLWDTTDWYPHMLVMYWRWNPLSGIPGSQDVGDGPSWTDSCTHNKTNIWLSFRKELSLKAQRYVGSLIIWEQGATLALHWPLWYFCDYFAVEPQKFREYISSGSQEQLKSQGCLARITIWPLHVMKRL